MRTTIGGIAVDKVSAAMTALSISGNDKLMDFLANGARVTKIRNPGHEMQIEIVPGSGPKPHAGQAGYWAHPYGAALNHGKHIPKFGQTSPTKIELLHVNGEPRLIITMPEPDRRTKPLRGRHKPKTKAVESDAPLLDAIDKAQPEDTPEKDAERPVTQCHAPLPTDPLLAVQNLINELNMLDKLLRGGVKIQRSIDGNYNAVIEIHPGDK